MRGGPVGGAGGGVSEAEVSGVEGEGRPGAGGHVQRGEPRVLGVPDEDGLGAEGHLDAVVA